MPVQGSAGTPAAELRPGYNWSLAWSLSASGLTVWPGEGAWGGWETGGRPWDRDIALGTMPSTAAGMPLGATPTTPGGYLLGEEVAREPGGGGGGRPVQPRPAPCGRDPGRCPVHHPEGCLSLRRACPSHPRPGGPEPRLPVGCPIELGVHHGGVHTGPVGGSCKVVLVDAVLQAVGDPAWETRGAKDGACVPQPPGPRGALTGTGPPPQAHGPQAEWAPPVR